MVVAPMFCFPLLFLLVTLSRAQAFVLVSLMKTTTSSTLLMIESSQFRIRNGSELPLFFGLTDDHDHFEIAKQFDETENDVAETKQPSSLSEPMGDASSRSKRWVGNTKPSIRTLVDIPKAKKHSIQVSVQNVTKVLHKKKYESIQHVLIKAVLWKIFHDQYKCIDIERDIGDAQYLPDVVALDADDDYHHHLDPARTKRVLFWGESGRMTLTKAQELCERYPTTHIVWMRWGVSIQDFTKSVAPALVAVTRNRPGRFELAALPMTSGKNDRQVWEYFKPTKEDGAIYEVLIDFDDVEWFNMQDFVGKSL